MNKAEHLFRNYSCHALIYKKKQVFHHRVEETRESWKSTNSWAIGPNTTDEDREQKDCKKEKEKKTTRTKNVPA